MKNGERIDKELGTGDSGLTGAKRTYTGHMLETDDGLYYCHARWYDAGTGRFIQSDSVLDGFNRYAYCGNNPVIFSDPTGRVRKNPDGTYDYSFGGNPHEGEDSVASGNNNNNGNNGNSGDKGGKSAPKPTYFNQNQWVGDDFADAFHETACCATAVLNAVSNQYTQETGEVLSFDDAKRALKAAMDAGSIDNTNGYVNDLEAAANDMAKTLGLKGTFKTNEVAPDHEIYAFSKSGNETEPVHFSYVVDQKRHLFIDSWDGKTKGWTTNPNAYWSCAAVPGITDYRCCPLQQGRSIRGFDYIMN